MIAELVFLKDGKPRPAYVVDCIGNLVRCSAKSDPEALLPYSVELVSKSSELQNPYPWTLNVEALVSRLRFVAEATPQILLAYPGMDVPKFGYPFVPPAEVQEDEALIEQAMDILPTLAEVDAVALRAQLAEVGVYQIPRSTVFLEGIHEAAGGGITIPPLEELSAGWMSSTKIYRKAVVRSA